MATQDAENHTLRFPEFAQHCIYGVECSVYLFSDLCVKRAVSADLSTEDIQQQRHMVMHLSRPWPAQALNNIEQAPRRNKIEYIYLGASQHNFARDEDEKHDFGLNHAVDETREQLRHRSVIKVP